MITFALPYPPSLNTYWRHVGARVLLCKAGRLYREQVWAIVRETGAQKLTGRVAVTIAATMPDRRTRDLDNIPKAILDGLKYGGAYEDDSQIDDLRVYRAGTEKPGAVMVTVADLSADSDLWRKHL